MIYITGDLHGSSKRFTTENFPQGETLTRDDYVIVCGDFGMLWKQKESKEERMWLNWLNNKPFTTLFVDGNHENFNRLNAFPVETWHGGKVHFVKDHIIHLMRGEMFDLNGFSVFAFGGARSHDIDGEASEEELKKDYTAGILQPDDPHTIGKLRCIENYGGHTRIENVNWWRAEMPTEEEMQHGLNTLQEHSMKTDFIVSHDGPISDLILGCDKQIKLDPLNQYFEKLRQTVDYKKWYFGHHHLDKAINDKEIVIYHRIVQIA